MSDMNKLLFSITMKCSRLRNGVVWGSSLMNSPFFVFLNVNVLIADSKCEWTNVVTKGSHVWRQIELLPLPLTYWRWILKRVNRAFVLCEWTFVSQQDELHLKAVSLECHHLSFVSLVIWHAEPMRHSWCTREWVQMKEKQTLNLATIQCPFSCEAFI